MEEQNPKPQSGKIYTKKGDLGQTSFLSGEKVYKDNIRVEAYGTLDELNVALGFASSLAHSQVAEVLEAIQKKIFGIASHIAISKPTDELLARLPKLDEGYIEHMEHIIDQMTDQMEPLKNFIVPGQTTAGGAIAMARTTCRRAERRMVSLLQVEEVDPLFIKFVNRLSDLLFTLERFEYHLSGVEVKKWLGN
jgi:cob(I)alamin adenosyltransferase